MDEDDDREPSDLFSLKSGGRVVKTSILPVEEVLTPPEELRKQRVRKMVLAAIASVLALITIYTVYHFAHEASVRSAVLAAGESGRVPDVHNALDTLGSRESLGLRARLEAMLALEGELPIDEAQAAVDAVPDGDDEEASERLKAEVYIAMARGDAQAAQAAAGRLIAAGTYAGETAHAKALAAWVVGDPATAVTEARASTVQHETAPRYLARLGLALSLSGETDEAIGVLAPGGDSAAIRAARARILVRDHRDGANAEADAVLADESALASEKAWAHLVNADVAAWAGAREDARAAARQALEAAPPGDALFRWELARVFLMAEAASEASATLADMSGPVADPALAGRVNAWVLLERGDSAGALAALAEVPAGPEALLLVGRAHQARGAIDEARATLQRVSDDASFAARGLAARAQLELGASDAAAAVLLSRQALEVAPNHPAFVPVAVAALLASDAADDALTLANTALEAHPNDARILEAVTDALLAKNEFRQAVEVARRAAERAPEDADIHAKRGEAARGIDEFGEARTAYEAALEREEAHPVALVGLLAVDVTEGNVQHASSMLERIDAAGIDTDEVMLLRVHNDVASGAGLSATRGVMRATRRAGLRRNSYLRRALAELYLQGGFYRQAVGMYEQARRMGENEVEMRIGRAMAHALDRKTNLANTAITEALEAALPEGSAEGTPSPAVNNPRLLAVRARMELNLGRFPSAKSYAERALTGDATLGEAHLVLAEIAIRRRRDPSEALRAALRPPNPQPSAAALLARRLGSTEEGCELAAQYLRAAARAAEHVDSMDALRERCSD